MHVIIKFIYRGAFTFKTTEKHVISLILYLGVSTSRLNKFIIGKEEFDALATSIDQKVIANAYFRKHFFKRCLYYEKLYLSASSSGV
jgi:hypothetical protein